MKLLLTLDRWFQENNRIGADVSVNIADSYARYTLIPWPNHIVKEEELSTYSTVYFEDKFGNDFENWNIKVDWPEYGKAGVGCALEREFTENLDRVLRQYKLRLVSLQTHFVRVYNNWRRLINQKEFLFVVVEQEQFILASIRNKVWCGLRSIKTQGSDDSFALLLERELLLQGIKGNTTVYIYGDELGINGGALSMRENVIYLRDVPKKNNFFTSF